MERRAARGPLHKHFDLERKMAKQAEARLCQQLQRLEDICLYRVKLLTREQRQLRSQQQRLQKADIFKVRLSSSLGNGTQKRPEGVLRFPPQGGQKHGPPKDEIRALATNMTQEMYKIKSQMPPLCHTGLKNPTRRKEPGQSQSHRAISFVAEKPQAQEKESENPPPGTDPKRGISAAKSTQSPAALQGMAFTSTPSGGGMVHLDETKPAGSAGEHTPPGSMDWARGYKGGATKPTFSELFAKAKNAHYLRHRVPPESERLLSIREIFGCRDPSTAGQERIVEMVPSKFPPL